MNTTENNKLIAEFMGWRERKDPTERWFGQWEGTNGQLHRVLHFNSDWDWLMEVIEKIESLDFTVVIEGSKIQTKLCIVEGKGYYKQTFDGTKIKATYYAVIEFIKWYNKQK